MAALLTRTMEAAGAFFRWWGSELAALVPRRLTQLLFPPPKFLVVEPSEHEIGLWYLRGARTSRLQTIGLENKPAAGVRDALGEQIRRIDLKSAVTVLRLPASQGLRCRLTLPAAAEQDIRSALALQVDRQTPFAPEDAAFDYRILARDRQTKQLSVEMAVVPHRTVQSERERCAGWGLSPEIVDLAEEGDAVGPPRENLVADAGATRAGRPWRLVNATLAALAIALFAAALYLPVQRERTRAEGLLVQVAAAKSTADEVLGLQGKIDERQSESRFFGDLKASSPPKVLVLDELTRVLPDDTWIRRLSLDGREVRITGYSPTASSLVGLIDDSDIFGTPKFLSTVTADPETGLENFKLSFEVEAPSEEAEE